MTDPAPAQTCSALSATDEPLPGTAAHVTGWLCLEHPGAWGRDVLGGEALGPELSAELGRRTEAAGVRFLLIRRPGRAVEPRPGRAVAPPSRRTVLIGRSDPSGAWCERLEVSDPAELLELDLDLPASAPGIGEPVTEPVTLVCAHGKRDQCCAVFGRPVAAELSARFGDSVWECSHTGGHRFAPSMILLPTGYTYGRLTAQQSVEVVLAAGRGEVRLEGLRGRSCWEATGQAAEIAVRERVPAGASDLTVDESGAVPVVCHRDGRAWEVELSRVELDRRPPSCGAAEKAVVGLAVELVRPLLPPAPKDEKTTMGHAAVKTVSISHVETRHIR